MQKSKKLVENVTDSELWVAGSEAAQLHVTQTQTAVVWPFFCDYPDEQVPEEIIFWTLWCKWIY